MNLILIKNKMQGEKITLYYASGKHTTAHNN